MNKVVLNGWTIEAVDGINSELIITPAEGCFQVVCEGYGEAQVWNNGKTRITLDNGGFRLMQWDFIE